MMKKFFPLILVIALVFAACTPKQEAAPAMTSESAPVSDGSEDLTIDFAVGLEGDESVNMFTWKTNVRYMAAEDTYDAATGASAEGSTHLFMMALYDIEAKEAMSSGLRGLFLFGVNGNDQVENDNLHATEEGGVITIQYVHRGTAFKFVTDSKGVLSLPDGDMKARKIGTPQELESEFTSDGTAQGVDFEKVWSKDVMSIGANPESMYFWDGDLQVELNDGTLSMNGVLTAVAR